MTTITLSFEMLSFWHCGTGKGAGTGVDAVVVRTQAGLPFIPGRTVKGLLREAVTTLEQAGALGQGSAERHFGSAIGAEPGGADDRVTVLEEARFRTTPGLLRFGSAHIGKGADEVARWERWAAGDPAGRASLFRELSSTKLDQQGVAAGKTLRTIEVVVPLTLHAQIDGPDDTFVSVLEKALPLVDGVGSHRSRGLGRVQITRVA